MTRRFSLLICFAWASSVGCTPDAPDPDPTPESMICHGDALEDDVPFDTSVSALEERWDVNTELLRVLFVGEPL